MADLTRLLAKRGYQNIWHVTVNADFNDRIGDRLAGYKAACAGDDCNTAKVITCENSFQGGAQAIALAMDSNRKVDALSFATDVMAVGEVLECRRPGVEVPNRLAIAGFDDLPIASSINPTLTTVNVDRIGMGPKVAEILMERINGDRERRTRSMLAFKSESATARV